MPRCGGYEKHAHVHRGAQTVFASMPVATRYIQEITRLQHFIENQVTFGRRRLLRHTPYRDRYRSSEELPALGSFYLDDQKILGVVVNLERTLPCAGCY